jgi:hypothetical protein
MSQLRFTEGVSWQMLGAYGDRLGGARGQRSHAIIQELSGYSARNMRCPDFMRLASELAESDPHRALQLANEYLHEGNGWVRRNLGPNDLISISELQSSAMAAGLSRGDLHGYQYVTLAQPRTPPQPARQQAASPSRRNDFGW